ncbi:PP2C family protein-serine/threonine phosphatase [Dethiothermospora halolimnae]|uniref:PP2C family protein-serine/threonine phosphatase n=1 Tax=Dethiothermospora halolimnae TaxID=3114390 RepID=UPI003CCBBD99
MRKINSKIITKFTSEAGSKLHNKDYFAFAELDKYAIYVIVDGIDNDKHFKSGKIAVSKIISSFSQKPSMKRRYIKKLLNIANKELINESKEVRLKASITIVVTNYVKVRYGLVGNTRFSLFRDGFFKHQSKDQSLTQQLIETEQVELDKAAKHEERNNLYCYLGQRKRLTPYISKAFKLKDGDIISLSTRGLWEQIDSGEMLDVLTESKECQEVVDNVEDMLLSKQPKDLDNYTLAVIFIDKTYKNPKRKKRIKKIIFILIPILVIIIIILIIWYIRHQKRLDKIETMNYHIEDASNYIEDDNFPRAFEEYTEALDLARELELKVEKGDINKNLRLVEIIIEGDKSYQDKKYKEALDKYLLANKKTYYTDNLAKKYINEKLDKTREHLKVWDVLKQGDKKMDLGDYQGAKENYLLAKDLAYDLFFIEAKDEANEKLDKISEIEAELSEKNQKKEEEEKEKEAKRAKAMETYMKGDMSYSIGKYYDAKIYYETAKEIYKEIEEKELVEDITKKIELVDKIIKQANKDKSKAEAYEKYGDEEFDSGDIFEAQTLYIFARDIYEKYNMSEEMKGINEKIEKVKEIIHNQGSIEDTETDKGE